MGVGVYPHTLFNPINYLTPTFLLITLLLLPCCSCSSTLPSCSDCHTAALLFLLCHSCCLPLLLSYLYLPIPMFIVLLSYSHAHASAVLLQFPIPRTFFNSLLSYCPLLILLLSCCPTFLLSCSLTFCLLSYSCSSFDGRSRRMGMYRQIRNGELVTVRVREEESYIGSRRGGRQE